MADFNLIKDIAVSSPSKIVMLVIDGLGGLPDPASGKTELETASTPNLDRLAADSICGLIDPVGTGITSGSGPGHLALFGYEPLKYVIGRGVLEALGVDFDLKDADVAARGNFCTIDRKGLITDRRAGRISTEKSRELCELLSGIKLDDAQLFLWPVAEHRFLLVFRSKNLSDAVSETDPQKAGVVPNIAVAVKPEAENTARLVNEFANKAAEVLNRHYPANMVLLRGFSRMPDFPMMPEIFKLKPAAIVDYPMYKGIAKLLGMSVLPTGKTIKDQLITLAENFSKHDFFYIHFKKTDSAGEDGNFKEKVKLLEEIDGAVPALVALKPEVIVVTGDHSTPALLKGHSWHPVPFLLHSPWCRPDGVREFSERACLAGGLGRFPAAEVMTLAMANALKLTKFGA